MAGMMSHIDIIKAIKAHEMIITPFDPDKKDERLTPAGFNFSFTNFIISLNKKEPCDLQINEKTGEIYFNLAAGDTALALTRETIWVSGKYAGTFHSKVGFAAKGLGQISTTLDPGWKGQLLISINNPNKNDVPVVIGERIKPDNTIKYRTFITLCLYALETPATKRSDNTSGRLEIIDEVLAQNFEKNSSLIFDISKLKNLENELMAASNIELGLNPITEETYKNYVEAHNIILAELEKIATKSANEKFQTFVKNIK